MHVLSQTKSSGDVGPGAPSPGNPPIVDGKRKALVKEPAVKVVEKEAKQKVISSIWEQCFAFPLYFYF